MKRTTSQLVYDLLDREGLLPATEIAKRLGIIRGTACSARDRWRKAVRGPQPSFRKPTGEEKGAPAEVTPGGITIDEAIKHLDDCMSETEKILYPEVLDAHKLGIEALKLAKANRDPDSPIYIGLLPGEKYNEE